jgi:LCP family protein required for cell wall assembly
MKPSAFYFVLILFAVILSACGTPAQAKPQRQFFAPFVLITAAPNVTPTPTPFQPSSNATAYPPFILNYPGTPQIFAGLPSETPSPTPTYHPGATPTADLSLLFPTVAAPPVVETVAISPTPLPPLTTPNETVNFLLIGSDKRPGKSYRTDTLVVAVAWLDQGQVSLISIPRDLWVYIPDIGMQRINTAYQSGETSGYAGGGPGLLKDTIAYNLGIRIDYTAMVDFDGFRRIVDTLGGVEVPVGCSYTDWRLTDPSYDPENENNWWLFTVGPGNVHMDGDLALWYARARSKSNDFDRGRRQQEVLRSIFNKALQTDTFKKVPQLYNDFSSTIITDMGLTDMASMSPYALNFTNANIRGYYIRPPYVSSWVTPGGAAVLLPNDEPLKQMLTEATTLSAFAATRETITIEVQNGSPLDAYDALAASRLNYAGYQTVTSPADKRDYGSSVLVDFTAAQDLTQQQIILAALNLTSANVIALPNGSSTAQYRVILGYDYNPCFQPQDLSH